jgi:hypothetical protein
VQPHSTPARKFWPFWARARPENGAPKLRAALMNSSAGRSVRRGSPLFRRQRDDNLDCFCLFCSGARSRSADRLAIFVEIDLGFRPAIAPAMRRLPHRLAHVGEAGRRHSCARPDVEPLFPSRLAAGAKLFAAGHQPSPPSRYSLGRRRTKRRHVARPEHHKPSGGLVLSPRRT